MNIEITLTEEQIEEVIMRNLSTIDVDELLRHVSLNDTINHIQTFDNGIAELLEAIEGYVELHEEDIVKLLTFENSNKVARSLYLKDIDTARAYYEEIGYWLNSNPVGLMK